MCEKKAWSEIKLERGQGPGTSLQDKPLKISGLYPRMKSIKMGLVPPKTNTNYK